MKKVRKPPLNNQMCIFAGDVNVGKTRIAVALCAPGRQFTMYENAVDSDRPNAMILPVPGDAAHVELVDMSTVHSPWEKLEDATPRGKGGSGKDEYDLAEFAAIDEEPPLEVHQVGAYRCSLAPSIGDLKRSLEIELPPNIEAILGEHYGTGYCFLICQFDAAQNINMHPIAYTHDIAAGGSLFIPTRHAHGGTAKRRKTESGNGNVAPDDDDDDKGDYDHTVYMINCCVRPLAGGLYFSSTYMRTQCKNLAEFSPNLDCGIYNVQRIIIPPSRKTPNGDHWSV